MKYIYEITKLLCINYMFYIIISTTNINKIEQKLSSQEKNYNEISNETKPLVNNKMRIMKDILFINGCDSKILSHPYRYRVLHQMEQLSAAFLESEELFYLDLEPFMVRDYRIIIFFRCPWTEKVEEAIKLAKILNKKNLFDIDDLVIDTKYTDMIPYIKTLSPKEKLIYNDGVVRIGKTLKLCDIAITTTEALAKELKHYIPSVFINHNVASEEMWKLSQNALLIKDKTKINEYIIIGYFSGSITHNSDLEMIIPALIKILQEFKNVKIMFLGDIAFPKNLTDFSSQIIYKNFTNWKELPEIISNVDINLAPIINNTFNEAKSENKWVEAALVKVPTVASNIGAFKNVIVHNKTGLLCSDINDWYISLKSLIKNELLRKTLGENAYNICLKEYNTIYTGIKFVNFINSIANKHIGFFLPSLKMSGGIYVILKHACILKDEGWDVDLILPEVKIDFFEFQGHIFNTIGLNNVRMDVQFNIIVATLYSTLFTILNYYKTQKYLYLVQNYETDFYPYGNNFRADAEKSYSVPFGVEFITISKWCKNWLWRKYRKKSSFAPNGIDLDNFSSRRRQLKLKEKIRILIEGDSSSHYKNVDESFKIIEKLDRNKFEVWYLSNNGKPKDWYKIDRFFNEIPKEKVNQIYYDCDILLKSSWLESFSYPPLEMMATGGYSIVVPNGGNIEYLKDKENCLFYKLGDINDAKKCLESLINDEQLQEHLYRNGLLTAKKRDWKNFKNEVISLYEH